MQPTKFHRMVWCVVLGTGCEYCLQDASKSLILWVLLLGQVSGQQAKEEVSQLVRGLGAVLEEKRASLLQAIEECQQERLSRLSAQIHEHQSLLDGSGLVGYAQEVLKETDQPCFVQAAKQLHNRYTRVQAPGRWALWV